MYRFDPRTFEVDFHFPVGPNPHGDVFDQWGYQFASDGTGGSGYYVHIGHGVNAVKPWYRQRVRPVPATGILSSSHFPPENQGNFLICNSIGVLGVLQHKVEYDGADINAVEVEPILLSSDPNFRPADVKVGGDGALYIADWQNPLIGHMQHNIRDPNRDHTHGRIYRVTATGRPLLKPARMKGKPTAEVAAHFFDAENGTRYRARLELSGRNTREVTEDIARWAASVEPDNAQREQSPARGACGCSKSTVCRMSRWPPRCCGPRSLRVRARGHSHAGALGRKPRAAVELVLAAARDGEPLVRAEAVKAAVGFPGLPGAEVISRRPIGRPICS